VFLGGNLALVTDSLLSVGIKMAVTALGTLMTNTLPANGVTDDQLTLKLPHFVRCYDRAQAS
jgi:hypothetical protein